MNCPEVRDLAHVNPLPMRPARRILPVLTCVAAASTRGLVRIAAAWLLQLLAFSVLAQSAGDRREWPKTDFGRITVEWGEILSGGPPKDGIPAIDRPRFVSVAEARGWLRDHEPVIVLRVAGEARAYPLQILTYHEIVNDTVAGKPVVVTFCPLCNAALVFERTVDGRKLDFGTTGRLRMSDLVMYDRQSESWWQQFSGEGIVGRHAGKRLRELPAEIASFGDFATAYPSGRVLSRDTGHPRPYGRNPYAGYDRADQSPFLFRGRLDDRLPPMERVLAVESHGKWRLYPLSLLEGKPLAQGELAGVPYAVFARDGMASALDSERIEDGRRIPAAAAFDRRIGGRVLEFQFRDGSWVDSATGTKWNLFGEGVAGPLEGKRLGSVGRGVHFAFAWLAFRPDSEIVRALPG